MPLFINAQEIPAPAWESLHCDTALTPNAKFNIRSVVLHLLKKDTLTEFKVQKIYFGTNADNTANQWVTVDQSTTLGHPFIDSLSVQFLKSLIEVNENLYEKWKPWLEKDRTDFLNRRNALMRDFSIQYPNLKINVISDIRSRNLQNSMLKKGYSQANISFHEWGLASDFGIYLKRKYLKQIKYYLYLEEFTKKYHLRWGGNFVGFVDYPHVQLYYNGAELLRKHPYLAIEYEVHYKKYLNRIKDKIAQNKEDEVEDSKELLSTLNDIRKREKCYLPTNEHHRDIPFELPKNFNSNNDILIYWDEQNSKLYTIVPRERLKKHKSGDWK